MPTAARSPKGDRPRSAATTAMSRYAAGISPRRWPRRGSFKTPLPFRRRADPADIKRYARSAYSSTRFVPRSPAMNPDNVLYAAAVWIIPLVIAIVFHEVAHGLMARVLGDPTA